MARKLELQDIGMEDVRRELEEQLDRDSIVALCIEAGVDEASLEGLSKSSLTELFLEQGNLEALMGKVLGLPVSENSYALKSGTSETDEPAEEPGFVDETGSLDKPVSAKYQAASTNDTSASTDDEALVVSPEELKEEMSGYWSLEDLSDVADRFEVSRDSYESKDDLIKLLVDSVSPEQLVAELMAREESSSKVVVDDDAVGTLVEKALDDESLRNSTDDKISVEDLILKVPVEVAPEEETMVTADEMVEKEAGLTADTLVSNEIESDTDDEEPVESAVEDADDSHEDDDMAILKQMRAFRSNISDEDGETASDIDLDLSEGTGKSSLVKVLVPLVMVACVGGLIFIRHSRPVLFKGIKTHVVATGKSFSQKIKVMFSSQSGTILTSGTAVSVAGTTPTSLVDSLPLQVPTTDAATLRPFIISTTDQTGSSKGAVLKADSKFGTKHLPNSIAGIDGSDGSGPNSLTTHTGKVVDGSLVANVPDVVIDSHSSKPADFISFPDKVNENRSMILGTAFKRVADEFANPDSALDVFAVASKLSVSNDTIKAICEKILNTESGFSDPLHKVVHFMAKRDFKEAESVCSKSLWGIKRGSERSFAYLLLAKIRLENSNPKVARRTYELSLKEDPASELAVLGMYRSSMAMNMRGAAEVAVTSFLKEHPSLLLESVLSSSAVDSADIVADHKPVDSAGIAADHKPVDSAGIAADHKPVDSVTIDTDDEPVDSADIVADHKPVDSVTIDTDDEPVDIATIETDDSLLYNGNGITTAYDPIDHSDPVASQDVDSGETLSVVDSVDMSGGIKASDSSALAVDISNMTLAEVLVLAKKYEGDHLYSEAVNYYKASLDRNMSDAERSQIQLDLAFCLRVEKKYDEALDYARKAKNLGREISPGLWILLNMQK